MIKKYIYKLILLLSICFTKFYGQLIHPGLSLKRSNLDRMKYMVEAKISPWYATFDKIQNDYIANPF